MKHQIDTDIDRAYVLSVYLSIYLSIFLSICKILYVYDTHICILYIIYIYVYTSKIERFTKRVEGFHPSTIFAKRSFLDVWHSSEYVSVKYQAAVTLGLDQVEVKEKIYRWWEARSFSGFMTLI